MRIFSASVGAFIATMIGGSAVHADVSSIVYEDAKAVMAELVTVEVAENVVPTIACLAPPILDFYPRSLQLTYDRKFGQLRESLKAESKEIFTVHLARFVRTQWSDPWKLDLAGGKVLADIEKCKPDAKEKFRSGAFRNLKPHNLDAECAYRDKFEFDREVGCALARAAEAALEDRDADVRRHLLDLLAIMTYEASRGLQLPPHQVTRETLTAAYAEYFATEPTVASTARLAERLRALAKLDKDPPLPKALTEVISLAESLSGTYRLLAKSDAPSLSALVDGLFAIKGVVATHCGPSCDAVVAALSRARPVLRAASTRQWKLLATSAIDFAFSTVSCPKGDADCDPSQHRYRTFATSLAVYAMDLSETGDASAATRAAFRGAAIDVISDHSPAGLDRGFFRKTYAPDLSLRYQWSASYLNRNGADGVRVVPTIDWLILRAPFVRTEKLFVAAQVSLVDPLAPFVEFANRPDVSWSRPYAPLALLLSPRLDVVLGVPMLSRRLAISAGLGLRSAWAVKSTATTATGTPEERFDYVFFFESDKDGVSRAGLRRIEFGLAVKYVL